MKKEEINYPALLALLGLLTTFWLTVAHENKNTQEIDKHDTIEELEEGYYIPTYEVQIKWGDVYE